MMARPTPLLDDIPEAHIEDWFGERLARPSIARGNSPTTLILADDIDLSNRSYSFAAGTCSKNVIIIANTVRLSTGVHFNLSPEEGRSVGDRSGGSVAILARTFRFTDNAFIYFNGMPTYFLGGNKNDLNRYDWHTAPASGGVYLSCERLDLSPSLHDQVVTNILGSTPDLLPERVGEPLREDVRASLLQLTSKAYGDTSVRDAVASLVRSKTVFDNDLIDIALYLKAKAVDESIAHHGADLLIRALLSAQLEDANNAHFAWMARPIPGQIVGSDKFEELYQRFSPLKRSVSRWVIRWYAKQHADALTAMLRNDKAQLYTIYQAIEHFPNYTIDGSDIGEYQDITTKLLALREQAKLALYAKSITINTGGVDIDIDAFGENNSTRLRLLPTNALIQDISFDGRRFVGIVNFNPSSQNELTFYLSASLSIDPRIGAAVATALAATGQQLEGPFTNWRVKTVTFGDVPGLLRERSSIAINGSTIRAALVFDTGSIGALGLLAFSSQAGIPLSISWEYIPDPTYSGRLTTITLSRVTRATAAITYTNGSLRNNENYPVLIHYVKAGDSRFIPYSSVVPSVQPGASVSLPLTSGIDPRTTSIPPEAIEVVYEKPREYLDFYPIHGEQLAEEVSLENEIGPVAQAQPGRLLNYIEVTVTYTPSEAKYKQTWTTQLAPSGAAGSRQSRWFLRPSQINPSITVNGKAFYSDNSSVNISPRSFSTPIIHITGDLLTGSGSPNRF